MVLVVGEQFQEKIDCIRPIEETRKVRVHWTIVYIMVLKDELRDR